jgi:integrase
MATLIFDRHSHRSEEKTVQPKTNLEAPKELAIIKNRLRLEELPFLSQLGEIVDGVLVMRRGFKGYPLKKSVSIQLDKILSVGETGLCKYIFESLVPQRPALIPWVLQNKTLLELAAYMLRARSGSKMGFYGYSNTLNLHCRRLNTEPDQLIADVTRGGYPDPARVEKHRTFLQSCLNELDDMGRSPGRLRGYSRQIRTFYRVNGVELPKPKYLPKDKTVSKDRSPTQEELQHLIDLGNAREKFLVSLLASTGLREGTVTLLTYRHVRQDLEAGVVPVHIRIELDETKGQYCDYSTFLGPECLHYLKVYLDERRRGTADDGHHQQLPPEEIRDESPLIRDSLSKVPRPIGEKAIYRILHSLLHRAGLLKKNKNGGYDLRVHSIRKFFKTQLQSLGVGDPFIDYWMGHKTSVYSDMEMKGVNFHRDKYSSAGLWIRPREAGSKVDLLRQMVGSIGATPDEIREALQSLAKPHRMHSTPRELEDQKIRVLTELLVDKVRDRLNNSSSSEPTRVNWWARPDSNRGPSGVS